MLFDFGHCVHIKDTLFCEFNKIKFHKRLKYSIDVTMNCMVLHFTEKYTEL